MNKKAILVAGATVGAVAGALFLAKKKGWNPLPKNDQADQEAGNGHSRAARKPKKA